MSLPYWIKALDLEAQYNGQDFFTRDFVAPQTHDRLPRPELKIYILPDFSVNFEFLLGNGWSTARLRKIALVYEVSLKCASPRHLASSGCSVAETWTRKTGRAT